jgi:MoaA/NifB/PqqE/SkfB family radical SAM enzyme
MTSPDGGWLEGPRRLSFEARLLARVLGAARARWGTLAAGRRLVRYLRDPRALPRGGGDRYLRLRGQVFAVPALPPLDERDFVDHLLDDLAALEAGTPAPLSLAMVCVTPRCIHRCAYCYNAQDHGETELLSLEILVRTVRDLAAAGVRNVFLSGGEPMLRARDLPLLLAACRDPHLGLWLVSTGYGMTPDRMSELRAAGLRGVMISLDGQDAAAHDRVKGRPGAFAEAVAALGACRDAGLVVGVNCLIGPALLERAALEDFVRWAGGRGAHFVSLNTPHPVAGDDSLRPLPVADLLAVERLAAATRRGSAWRGQPLAYSPDAWEALRGCVGGQEFVYVSPRGELMACPFLRDGVGRVQDTPVADLLRVVRGRRAGCRVCQSLSATRSCRRGSAVS